ncbi:hypothetical protein LINGRAHAP2_LOCUS28118 [Linum grandiflorum]
MIRLPFRCLKMYTNAPTGHSTTAAAANARNPTVGPNTLHRHGLLRVPHCTQIGTPTPTPMSLWNGLIIEVMKNRRRKVADEKDDS